MKRRSSSACSPIISRRSFLSGIAGLAATGYTFAYARDNEYEDIPGVEKAYLHWPGSRRKFIHIAQVHFYAKPNGMAQPEYDADMAMVDEIQGSIYRILSHMSRNMGVRSVYSEGVLAELEDGYIEKCMVMSMFRDFLKSPDNRKMRELVEARASQLRKFANNSAAAEARAAEGESRYASNGGGTLTLGEEIEYIQSLHPSDLRLERYFDKVSADWARTEGAVGQLAAEGRIVPRHTETLELRKKALEGLESGRLSAGHAHELFEEFLLGMAARSREDLIVTVYGAWHSWKANIANWNRGNPLHFSLVRIEPAGMGKFYARYPDAKPKDP